MTEEHKRKIGLANKGKTRTLETRAKLSESAKNKWDKLWMREKWSKMSKERGSKPPSRKGIKHTDLTKKKMSIAQSGANNGSWKGGYENRLMQNRLRRARKNGAQGFVTLGEWETLKAQFNWTCPSCGKKEPLIKLSQDHIIPLIKGGSNNIENIQPLCRSCNSRKYTAIKKFVAWKNE